MRPAAVYPAEKSSLGFQSWLRDVATIATARSPALALKGLPRGDGSTVLLLPGFFSGDWTMADLGRFLRALDYRVETAGIWFNPGPQRSILARLESALLRLTDDGVPIHLLGQSLGGVFARDLACRHPGRIKSVITLCTPIRFPVTTPLAPLAAALAPVHDPEWISRANDIASPLSVPVTAIYSCDDGIVDWRECLQAESASPEARIAIAEALAGLRESNSAVV